MSKCKELSQKWVNEKWVMKYKIEKEDDECNKAQLPVPHLSIMMKSHEGLYHITDFLHGKPAS